MAITLIARPESARAVRVLVYKTSKKRKNKRSSGTFVIERTVRRTGQADSAFMDRYLKRHRRSNSKRQDGWIRDMDTNVFRADRAGRKKLKVRRILGF